MTVGLRIIVQSNIKPTRKRMEKAVFNGLASAEQTLLTQAKDLIVARLNVVLRRQTPYYRTKIRVSSNRVDDSNVIYGPWLEGTGSRNKTTRFKGYFTFRRIKTQIDRRKGYVTDKAMKKAIKQAGL